MRHLLPFRYVEAIAEAGSIRKASELLAITPSALNRRLLSLEEELGMPIFERLPSGVRLNTAGEILLGHIRNQISDLERVKSQIADLSGVRRGHVKIACSPEATGRFLAEQVHLYHEEHPRVTFSLEQNFRGAVEHSLVEHKSDIAIVFEPLNLVDFQVVLNVRQPMMCVLPATHILAKKEKLRLYECAEHPTSLPDVNWGIGYLLEQSALRLGLNLRSSIKSNSQEFLRHYRGRTEHPYFDIPINLPSNLEEHGLCAVPLDPQDVPAGFLFLGHLKGRTLPVAAARLLEQLTTSLAKRFE